MRNLVLLKEEREEHREMTFTVAMANLKGGAGKTTVTLNLAVAAEDAGLRTVIIDLDPQQAAAKWGDLRAGAMARPPKVISAMAARLPQAFRSAEHAGAKMIIIETPAHAEGILIPSIDASDLVLIPCRPTVLDLQHLGATVRLSDLRRKDHAVLLNAINARTNDRDQAKHTVAEMGINLIDAEVSHLVAYARALAAGQGATEFEPAGKAAAEMRRLVTELSGMYPSLLGSVDRQATQQFASASFNGVEPRAIQ
jgi:chromosome partitioning protein